MQTQALIIFLEGALGTGRKGRGLSAEGAGLDSRKSGVDDGSVVQGPVVGVLGRLLGGPLLSLVLAPSPARCTQGETVGATLLVAMHDAFEPVPILEKLPLQIDCLAAWGEPKDPGAEAGEVDGSLAGWASVGRCRRVPWDEGVQSIVDSEGGGAVWAISRDPGILGMFHLPLFLVQTWKLSFPY